MSNLAEAKLRLRLDAEEVKREAAKAEKAVENVGEAATCSYQVKVDRTDRDSSGHCRL